MGHGRVFMGIQPDQVSPFQQHIDSKAIKTSSFHWGGPTTVIHDLDGNELFFWLPQGEDIGA